MLMTLMLKFLYPWPKDTSEFQSRGSGSVFFAENILTVVIIIGHDGDFVGAGIVKRSDNRVDFLLAEIVQFGRTFGKHNLPFDFFGIGHRLGNKCTAYRYQRFSLFSAAAGTSPTG